MSPISLTCRRTVNQARGRLSTAFVLMLFLSASAIAWVWGLDAAVGTRRGVAEVLASAVAPFLPVLAAFFAMETWSEERRTGRIDLLLSIPVRERELVFGKFWGVWVALVFALLLFCALALVSLFFISPVTFGAGQLISLILAVIFLSIQGLLWSAVATMMSTFFTRGSIAACATVGLLVALPRGLWKALQLWSPDGRPAFGEQPLDAQVVDFVTGYFSSGVLLAYFFLTLTALFIATKAVMMLRFRGRGAAKGWMSGLVAILLAIACGFSLTSLAVRLDVTGELPIAGQEDLSPRLKGVLANLSGSLTVTCYASRKDVRFRSCAKFLRALQRQSVRQGGAPIILRFVDPRWDLGPAERLARRGVTEVSVVFEKGHRLALVPLDELGDRTAATALQRLVLPLQRRDIFWTTGHGEMSVGDYGPSGLSDMARDLLRSGYRNSSVDLLKMTEIPSSCALIIIADAKNAFSHEEALRVDAYLKKGGRLLVLTSPSGELGVASILSGWGIRPTVQKLTKARTLSGSDIIVSDFADHAISAPLMGQRILLENPLVFDVSAAATGAAGVDKIDFVPLARVDEAAVAVAVERGGGTGTDLSLRPTRLVAIGDASFVSNGSLALRANANREFFLNAIAYLSGTDASGASGQEGGLMMTNLDRASRRHYALWIAGILPLVVFVLMAGLIIGRRRRA